jgi:hypothetical protein
MRGRRLIICLRSEGDYFFAAESLTIQVRSNMLYELLSVAVLRWTGEGARAHMIGAIPLGFLRWP